MSRPDPCPPVSATAMTHKYLTTSQVAELLQSSVDFVYDLVAAGRLPVIRLGTGKRQRLLFAEAALDAYLRSLTTGPALQAA